MKLKPLRPRCLAGGLVLLIALPASAQEFEVLGLEEAPPAASLPTTDGEFVVQFSQTPPAAEPFTAGEFSVELLTDPLPLSVPQEPEIFSSGFESPSGVAR